MVLFWLAVGAMACAATAFLALPLLIGSRRNGSATSPTDEARRLAVYRDRRAEIESERDAGRLTDEEARRALDELVEDAAIQLPPSAADAQAGTRGLGRTQAVLLGLLAALVVPIAALMAYDRLGSPAVAGLDRAALRAGMSPQRPQLSLQELRDRVRNSPGDAEGWVMLAEAQRQSGDHTAAAGSFERASALMPGEAWLIAEQAEEVMRAQGGSFAGRPVELLERALAVDPNDNKSVALMGAAQYRLGNREAALVYMKKLAQGMAPGSREAEHIGELIARIEAEIGVASGGTPGPTASAPGPMASAPGPKGPAAGGPAPGAAAASGASISGTIDIDASLKAKVPAGATLFVLARGTDGSPIPIAAQRFSADRWPIAFELGDAQAMNPARLLSQAGAVTIEARISRSGAVGRQSGDPFGVSAEVKPGTQNLAVRIDRQVP